MTREQWKPIAGFEEIYRISDRGRVRSLDRVIVGGHGPRRISGQLRKPRLLGHHHWICLHNDGLRTYHRISDLVAQAFGGKL